MKLSEPQNLKWVLLIVLALTWGSSFILIKKSLEFFTAFQVGAIRVALAGIVLLPLGIRAVVKIPKKKWPVVILAGLLGNFFPMFLFPLAQLKISSSVTGILNTTVPLFVLLYGALIFRNNNTRLQVLGAVVAFLGASTLIYGSQSNSESSNILYAGFILLASTMYALNALIIKNYLSDVRSLHLSGAVFFVLFLPSIIILFFTGFFQDMKPIEQMWEAYAYVSILGLVGTALAMILFYKLISISSTVFASSVSYLMPIVAVMWGLLFGETLSLIQLASGLLILIGVYLIKEKRE